MMQKKKSVNYMATVQLFKCCCCLISGGIKRTNLHYLKEKREKKPLKFEICLMILQASFRCMKVRNHLYLCSRLHL